MLAKVVPVVCFLIILGGKRKTHFLYLTSKDTFCQDPVQDLYLTAILSYLPIVASMNIQTLYPRGLYEGPEVIERKYKQ